MQAFDRNDIVSSFGSTIYSRGSTYYKNGMVRRAWAYEDGDISGLVDGSDDEPYEVDLVINPARRTKKLTSICTCPYEDQCKHAVALALYALSNELPIRDRDDNYDDFEEGGEESVPELVIPVAPPVSLDIPVPREVYDWLRQVEKAAEIPSVTDPSAKDRLFYLLKLEPIGDEITTLMIKPVNRTILKSGAYGVCKDVKISAITPHMTPKHWTPNDVALLTDLNTNTERAHWDKAEFRIDGRHGERLLREVIATGRCIGPNDLVVNLGERRQGVFEWVASKKDSGYIPRLRIEGSGILTVIGRPWYVDYMSRECGPIECELPGNLVATVIRGGTIPPEVMPAVRKQFEQLGLPKELSPKETIPVQVRTPEPIPFLEVDFEICGPKIYGWASNSNATSPCPLGFGKLTFEYEGIKAPVDSRDIRIVQEDEVVILKRNYLAERYAKEVLLKTGWKETAYVGWNIPKKRGTSLCMVPSSDLRVMEAIDLVGAFASDVVPKLVESGWKVNIEEGYRLIDDSAIDWDISLESNSGIDWFEFKLGIQVEGNALDLRAVLRQFFKEEHSMTGQPLAAKNTQGDDFIFFGFKGQVIKFSRRRLSAILQPLVELFGGISEWPEELRVSKSRTPELEKFDLDTPEASVPWRTSDEMKRLRTQFSSFDHLTPVSEPEGFLGQLRGYQKEGLAWLQFLREFGFAGVLADDMGLGKTVQILAHIQTEKAAGRMDRPCLIVAPTSTMPNWRRECARFCPNLKVLTLQGTGRTKRFENLDDADIVLSTYPLIARDKTHLSRCEYHLLVLDEAQNIKNPVTAAAKAARELVARHRICLSGTPVENHLGELWALFHFLMPGFLGSDKEFKQNFRGPIEKLGDQKARERLARRIRPFMLRRTKSQVVKELPKKTEIIETIEFEDPQRDLYESIRVAMDEQVRSLIASQGFDKSRFQILDALLKLRQVCCDPRLVKLPAAKKVATSAKLDHLMEMLSVLLEEGRSVLLFSQFTSMLDLIEERLREAGLEWVRISGDTKDRDTPVERFQAGQAPLFLISLKAGGTGLNLTAADTVILYDPWWNPAVENQAIDRAHRIGQKKAVVVYKLVAAGTIEEKMLEMQVRKGDIARSILTDDVDGIRTLTADDLKWVFSKE